MDFFSDSMAWMARSDGGVTIGRGPFVRCEDPPEDNVAFYVGDFALSAREPWRIPASVERISPGELLAVAGNTIAPRIDWKSVDAVPFSKVFQEIMAAIHEGVFEKTVPVVTEFGIADEPPGPGLVAAMLRRKPPLHSYGWCEGNRGFAGATPELLFSLKGGRLDTMALAGTARSEDRDVFAVDDKEIREHEYVAQTLVAKLLDLGTVERQPRSILDLGSIVHFLTHISVELAHPASAMELLKRLHPTPALGPLPRTHETLALLLDWRSRLGCPPGFGAPFGLWDRGAFTGIVAIRGIWWDGCELALPAGCGIIEASRLVSEWRELRLKRDAVKQFLSPNGEIF